MFASPVISVICRSDLARHLIRHLFEKQKLSWALNLNDWCQELSMTKTPVGIIELQMGHLSLDSERISKLANDLNDPRFFAIVDPSLMPLALDIRSLGFIEIFDLSQPLDRLVALVQNHQNANTDTELAIEERVLANLPWKPYRDHSLLEN